MNCKDCCQDCQKIGCNIEVECTGYLGKPKTNADRIRAMTDEDLAEWIISITEDDTEGWLGWLKQEAKDD